MTLLCHIITYRSKRMALWVTGVRPCKPLRLCFFALKIVRSSRSIIFRHDLKYEGQSSKGAFLTPFKFHFSNPRELVKRGILHFCGGTFFSFNLFLLEFPVVSTSKDGWEYFISLSGHWRIQLKLRRDSSDF